MLLWSCPAGASLGILIGQLPVQLTHGPRSGLWLACVVAWFAVGVVVHELGHALAGWYLGWQVYALAIGPLLWERTSTGWRMGWNRHLRQMLGFAKLTPTLREPVLGRASVMVACGPLANFALIGVAVVTLLASAAPSDVLRVVAATCIFANGLLAGLTLYPGPSLTISTDGSQLLTALRGGRAAERRRLELVLVAFDGQGVRPRDWPPEVVARLVEIRGGRSSDYASNALAYLHAIDTGRIDDAVRFLALAAAQATNIHQPWVFRESAYFLARHERDLQRARQFYLAAQGRPHDDPVQSVLAETAVLWLSGDQVSVCRNVEAARAWIDQQERPQKWQVGRERLEELLTLSPTPASA